MTKLWLIAQTVVLLLGALIVIVLWPIFRLLNMITSMYLWMSERTKDGLVAVSEQWSPSS